VLTPDKLARLRAAYHPGRRVRFVAFGEPDRHELPVGTEGTVRRVDDFGTVHVAWDNGINLGCVVTALGSEREDEIEPL
jgi:hypothetical protein